MSEITDIGAALDPQFERVDTPMLEMNPEKREWVGLTDEEITQLYKDHAKYQEEGMKLSGWGKFAASVQAKLRERNT
jgi:hypothetical protein